VDSQRQLFVYQGKGAKDRVVYLSDDSYEALWHYLWVRPSSRAKEVFLVEKKDIKAKVSRCAASKNAWSIMPGRQASRCRVTNCGTLWPRSCSMLMRSW
jgi:integrase